MADDRILRYSEVRNRMQDGDVILFRGAQLVSWLIQQGSNSKYSHAGMIAWWHNRLMLFQAELACLQVVPLSVALHKYEGVADWYKLRDEHRAAANIPRILDEATIDLGLDYATSDLLSASLAEVAGTELPPDCDDPHALFCSQYVARCFRIGGLPLIAGKDDIAVQPGHIAASPILEFQGTILPDVTQYMARLLPDR